MLLLPRHSCRGEPERQAQLTQLDDVESCASGLRDVAWAGHLGGYGGRGRRTALHHAPTGAFGVGDDIGGGAASAARPRLGGAMMHFFSGVGGGGAVLDRGDRGDRHRLRHHGCGATLATARGVFAATTERGSGAGLGSDPAAPGTPGAAAGCGGDGEGGSGGVDGGAGDVHEDEDENENEAPTCRFCFEEADDVGTRGGDLIHPCACSGSQAYVHTRCLDTWQDTAVDGGLRCQVCRQLFKVPPKPWLEALWSRLQRFVRRRAGRVCFIHVKSPFFRSRTKRLLGLLLDLRGII